MQQSTHASANPAPSRRRRRMRALSHAMAWTCTGTSLALVAGLLFYWLATPAAVLLNRADVGNPPVIEPGWVIRVTGFIISMIPLGVLIYGLSSARRCFRAFSAGEVFSVRIVGRLRAFALCVLASALLKPFASAALTLLLTCGAAPGRRAVSFSLGSDTLLALIFAGTVAVIAWIMMDAIEIADENSQFV